MKESKCVSCSMAGQHDSTHQRLLISQLQLEIALLQGELQTEKKQLLRHTQKLQALQQESRKAEKNRRGARQKVICRQFISDFLLISVQYWFSFGGNCIIYSVNCIEMLPADMASFVLKQCVLSVKYWCRMMWFVLSNIDSTNSKRPTFYFLMEIHTHLVASVVVCFH